MLTILGFFAMLFVITWIVILEKDKLNAVKLTAGQELAFRIISGLILISFLILQFKDHT